MSNNTIDILASINKGVQFIVEHMSPQNSSEKNISKLNRGGAEVVADRGGDIPKADLKIDSVKNIINVLNVMSPAILNIAKLSGRQQRRFKSVISTVIDTMDSLNDAGKRYGDAKNLKDMLQTLTVAFGVADKVLKQMAMWTVLGPIATIGGVLAIPAFVTMGLLLKLINAMGINKNTAKMFDDMAGAFNKMTGVILKMTLITALLMGLGYILMSAETNKFLIGGLIMFTGVIVATISVMLLTGLASKMVKNFAFGALKDMMTMILGMSLIMGVFYAFGAFMDDVWETVGKGLLMFAGVCVAMLAVIGLAALASKKITNTEGIKSLGLMYLYMFASMALIVAGKYLSDFVQANYQDVLLGLGSTALVLMGLVAVAWVASKFKTTALKGAAAIGLVALIAYAAMGIVWASIELSESAKGKWGDITATLLAVTGIITVFGALAFAASYIAGPVVAGSIALTSISLFVLSSLYMVEQIIELHKLKEEADISWGDVYDNVFALSGVIGVFGILAGAMGLAAPLILAGSLSAASLILFVKSGANITKEIIELRKTIVDNDTNWKAIIKDVTQLSKVIGIFGAVGTAMSLALPFVLLGLGSVATIASFANKAIGIVSGVANLKKSINDVGGYQVLVNTIKTDIKKILGAFTYDNLELPLSVWDILKLWSQYESIGALTSAFVRVGADISKLARIVGVVDDQGRIAPVLSIDKDTGEVTYGEYADIKAIAKTITDTVVIFTTNLNTGLKDVKNMKATKEVIEVMGSLISPIATFAEALTKYDVDEEGKLAQVRIDENGEIKIGQHVDIKKVASSISSAVTIFVKELFSKENVKYWENIVYGDEWWGEDEGFTATKAALGVLSTIVSPVAEFVEVISKLEVKDGKIRRLEYDDKGNIVGEFVDLNAVAKSIANAISTFGRAVFESDGIKALGAYSFTNMEAMKGLSSFTDVISKICKLDDKKIVSVSKGINASIISVGSVLKTTDPDFKEFTETTIKFKDSILEFDDVLKDEKGNRKKAINDLKESVESLLNVFNSDNGTISNLLKLLNKLENLDSNKINGNINSININGNGGTSTNGGTSNINNETTVVGTQLSYEDVVNAITEAIDGMRMVKNSIKKGTTNVDSYYFETEN